MNPATSFAEEYIAQLAAFSGRSPLPRIRALHLPPTQPVQGHAGEFCAVELTDGSLGLSYVRLDDTLAQLRDGTTAFLPAGADALEVARRFVGQQGPARAIGFATANAISRCLFDRAGFRPCDSSDSIGQMNPQHGESIGMIGLFRPLLGRILKSGARLTVVELRADLVGEHDGYRVTLDAKELGTCSKVISTSTLLLNDTLDEMLAQCRNARWFAMIGPSAGCLPDALFARGVTLIGGSWIRDRQGFIAALTSGAPHSEFTSKYALTSDGYPGWQELIQRAGKS
ncbi:MAG: Rossmann-like domain-containing protein [Rhodoferax sp.]